MNCESHWNFIYNSSFDPFSNETGIVVNGVLALVHGSVFVANHVPLQEGANTITASATDTAGYTAKDSVTANAEIIGDYITVSADIESGVAILETTLTIETPFTPADISISKLEGPEPLEYLAGSEPNEIIIRMDQVGLYFFTAIAEDDQSNSYNDTIAILVLDEAVLDALLKAKWDGMRNSLSLNNVDEAIKFFDSSTKEAFRNAFSALSPSQLADIANELDNAQFIKMKKNSVEYDIRVFENDEEYSFYLLFIRGEDGLWRIRSF